MPDLTGRVETAVKEALDEAREKIESVKDGSVRDALKALLEAVRAAIEAIRNAPRPEQPIAPTPPRPGTTTPPTTKPA